MDGAYRHSLFGTACRKGRASHLLTAALSLLVISAPKLVYAQLTSAVTATGQYQFNSNVFDLQRGFPSGLNQYNQADWYYAYGAGLNLNEQVSQQNFYIRGTDTEYDYDHFSQLTHDEYNADGGWIWQLGTLVNGTIDVSRYRTMVPFYQIISVTLAIETDQRENASAQFQIFPKLKLNANGYVDHLQEPLPDEPNLQLSDSGGGATLSYLGTSQWSANLNAAYQYGSYNNAVLYFSPAYKQWTYTLGTTYQPTGAGGPSTFDFAIGRTSRESPYGADDLSGTTGHLDYTRQLTGKTSVTLAADRDISSFLTYAGADIGSSATISALWMATYKTNVSVGYSWVYALFPDQGDIAGTNRGDHVQVATLNISYNALQWLSIRPFANYQTRSSNFYGANFNDTIYGVSVLIQWPQIATTTPGVTTQPLANAGLPF